MPSLRFSARKSLAIAAIAAFGLALSAPLLTRGQGGLPAFPSAELTIAIADSGGSTLFTPLSIPASAVSTVTGTVAGVNVATQADALKAISFFGSNGSLQRTIIPLKNAATATFAPAGTTPNDNKPAQTIGAIYNATSKETLTLVAVWDAATDAAPKEIRLYNRAGAPSGAALPVVVRTLVGDDSGQVGIYDAGVVASARETCYTIGLKQICAVDANYTPNAALKTELTAAVAALELAYALNVPIDLDGAVEEVVGSEERTRCAKALAARTLGATIVGCTPNLAFAGLAPGQNPADHNGLIGVFSVRAGAAGLVAYDAQGNLTNLVDEGSYYVFDITPSDRAGKPGADGALFLVNADGVNHRIIASVVMEAFGASTDPGAESRRNQAAIKDGVIGGQGF
jgi:hypothetical protein